MHLKIALVTETNKWVQPQLYFGVAASAQPELKLESGTVSAQVDAWSKIEAFQRVTKVNPDANTVEMSNGKTFNYKALVLAPGFEHSMDHVEGLDALSKTPEEDNVFVHMLDHKERVDRNFYSGWNHQNGDMICYSPKAPYKGEGSDFYALWFEHYMRQDRMHGRAAASARIQYWTPNKEIFQFGYANEVALDECHKRGVEVMFGWEMMSVKQHENGAKVATFRNVDSGEVIEKDFNHMNVNPPSNAPGLLKESGLAHGNGLLDVNKYTLQHNKYENIFGFGDAVAFDTTRTMNAAMAQEPIVKNNVLRFLQGKDINGVYNGYSWMPFYLGHSQASSFAHLHDYEAAPMNHYVPHYGIFSQFYFGRMMANQLSSANAYGGIKKDHGPPYGKFSAEYDELEHNEYLKANQVPLEEVRHPAATARKNA